MNRVSDCQIAAIREHRRTHSIAETASLVGVCKNTVITYCRDIQREPCECGRPGGHKGWCTVLYAKHPKRHAVVRAFHGAINSKWTDEARALVRRQWEAGMRPKHIAAQVNIMLGRSDISAHAVVVQAGKMGARRPPGHHARAIREAMIRHHHGEDRAKLEEAEARWRARQKRKLIPPRKIIGRKEAAAIWADASLSTKGVELVSGVSYQSMWKWFGPRAAFIAAHGSVTPRHVSQPVPPPPPKPPERKGFSMLAMQGRDPTVALRLQQAAEASRGRVNPVMRNTLVP